MSAHILDICIPTFNREKYLRKCLCAASSIASSGDIQIYVVDNNSTDYDSAHFHQICSDLNVNGSINYANFGAAMNLMRSVSMGISDYLYIIGDDDLLLPRFADITRLIKHSQPDYIIFDDDLTEQNHSHTTSLVSYLSRKLRDPVLFNELTHLPRIIHKRSLWDYQSGLKQANTLYPHTWAFLSPLLCSPLPKQSAFSVSVLPLKKYILPSGISFGDSRPRPLDITEQQQIELTFQNSLFNIWASCFSALCYDKIDISILKQKYCKSVSRHFPGTYNYLMSIISP